MNIQHGKRMEALEDIGFIPSTDKYAIKNKETLQLVKLAMFHKCMDCIMQPLRDASFEGVELKDPWGQPQVREATTFCLVIAYRPSAHTLLLCTPTIQRTTTRMPLCASAPSHKRTTPRMPSCAALANQHTNAHHLCASTCTPPHQRTTTHTPSCAPAPTCLYTTTRTPSL